MPPVAVTIVGGAVRDVMQFVPVPALGACCATLAAIIAICHELRSQKRQATELCELCRRILAAVNAKVASTPSYSTGAVPADLPLASNIQKLEGNLIVIKKDLEIMCNLSFIKRLVKKENHADILSGHMNRLTWAVEIFQIENSIDIAKSLDSDRSARQEDSARFEDLLETIISNDQRLEETLQLNFGNMQSRMAEIQDMLLFATRQKTESPPGPERRFFELSHSKLVSMSGGLEPSTPPWVISSLDVELFEVIGRGANSTVYRGKWNGEEVAIKRLLDGVSDKTFMDEAALWANLSNHLRIHRFLRACISPKLIISAYHRHGDVTKYLKSNPDADRVALIRDIAVGMNFLHKNGGLHCDLKASNVLVDEGGKACISDFGLSKIRQESETITLGHAKNTDAPVTGTMRWMSPERLLQEPPSTKVDVYAFAMTCYEIFSGEIPFSTFGNDDAYVLVVKQKLRPRRPPSNALSDAVWDLVTQCWDHEPALRPPFSSIVSRLEAIITRPSPHAHTSLQSTPASDSWRSQQTTGSSHTSTTTTTASPSSSADGWTSQINTPTYSQLTPSTSVASLNSGVYSQTASSTLKPVSDDIYDLGHPPAGAYSTSPAPTAPTTTGMSTQGQYTATPFSTAAGPRANETTTRPRSSFGPPVESPSDVRQTSTNTQTQYPDPPLQHSGERFKMPGSVSPSSVEARQQGQPTILPDSRNVSHGGYSQMQSELDRLGELRISQDTTGGLYTGNLTATSRSTAQASSILGNQQMFGATSNFSSHAPDAATIREPEPTITSRTDKSSAVTQPSTVVGSGRSAAVELPADAVPYPKPTDHRPAPSTPRPVQSPLQAGIPLPPLYSLVAPSARPAERPTAEHADSEPVFPSTSAPTNPVRPSTTLPGEFQTAKNTPSVPTASNVEGLRSAEARIGGAHSASEVDPVSRPNDVISAHRPAMRDDSSGNWVTSQAQRNVGESITAQSSGSFGLGDAEEKTILGTLSTKKLSEQGEWNGEYSALTDYLRHSSVTIRSAALTLVAEMVERAEAHPSSSVIPSLVATTILSALGPEECHVTVDDPSARTWCQIVDGLAQDPTGCRGILHDKAIMEFIWSCTTHESRLSQDGWEILLRLSSSPSITNRSLFEKALARMSESSFDLRQLHVEFLSNCAKTCEEKRLLGHFRNGLVDIFVRALQLSRTASVNDSTNLDDVHGAHARRLAAIMSLRDISTKSPAVCDAMVLTSGFRTLPSVLQDDLAMRQRQPVIELLRNVIRGTKEEGEAFESLVNSEHGISPILVSSIRPAENSRVASSAWETLTELFDKLARYHNHRSWALRKQVGRNAGLQERLRDALGSPTVEVLRTACDVAAGLVSVPEGAAMDQATRALHEVAVMMVDNGLCAHLIERLKDTNAEVQPAAMKAITKIGLCLGTTKDERKAVLDLLSPLKKSLRESKDSEVNAAASAMFAELDPPGKSTFLQKHFFRNP